MPESGKREKMKLIETMLWTADTDYYLLDLHLQRLRDSARELGFRFDRESIEEELEKLSKRFKQNHRMKVRLLLGEDGALELSSESVRLHKHTSVPRTTIASGSVDSSDMFLYHKTTFRNFYDSNLEHYMQKGFYDVIFTNERGELTEGAWNNLMLKIDGVLYTPPVSCGLLNGVYRRFLLGKGKAREKVLYREDIENAGAVYCCNSVRGFVPVKYIEDNQD